MHACVLKSSWVSNTICKIRGLPLQSKAVRAQMRLLGGISSILGVYLQVLSKHSWYFMSHSHYQSSSPTQPKEVKQSHLQSRHPARQLHHTSHYTDCTDSRAIDCNSALDKARCVHLPIHLRCRSEGHWSLTVHATSNDLLQLPLLILSIWNGCRYLLRHLLAKYRYC